MISSDTEHQAFVLCWFLSVNEPVAIVVVVQNSILNTPPLTYSSHVMKGGILLGAMKRLMDSKADFK